MQSLQVCAIRVTRLAADGSPLTGANNGFVAKAPILVRMTPDNEDGVELSATNGCGTLCAYYKQSDQLKKYDVNFELCDLDHELIEILTDQPIVTADAATIGHTSKRVGTCSPVDRNGVAVEFWTKRWDACGPPEGNDLYWHWFWPRAYLQPGEFSFENDFATIPIEGFLQENPNFDHGSWSDNPWPDDADPLVALWGVVQDSAPPDVSDGYAIVN